MYDNLTIVSGGDSNYIDLLLDQAQSIRAQTNGDQIRLVYLDGGLSNNDKEKLSALNAEVLDPGWQHPLANQRSQGRDYLKINIAKCHLDKLLPDSEIILWIDGDTWLQNLTALDYFSLVAQKNKLAIVSQQSRLFSHSISNRQVVGNLYRLRNILYKNAQRAKLPKAIVAKLVARATLNAGAYALHQQAPHWQRFRYWQDTIIKKGRLFTSDQLAFGLAIYQDGLPFEALPDICNYRKPWRWDSKKQVFVDFYPPYDPVSIVHMCGQDKMREDPSYQIDMLDENDQTIKKSLRYLAAKTPD